MLDTGYWILDTGCWDGEIFFAHIASTGLFVIDRGDAATLVVGTSTVLAGPHPLAPYSTSLADALNPG